MSIAVLALILSNMAPPSQERDYSAREFARNYAPIPTIAAMAPDGALAIGCMNGVVFSLHGGLKDFFRAGFSPSCIEFSKSGRYMTVDEMPPDDPCRLFVYDREYGRMVAVVVPNHAFYTSPNIAFTADETGIYMEGFAYQTQEETIRFLVLTTGSFSEVVDQHKKTAAQNFLRSESHKDPRIQVRRVDDRKTLEVVRTSDGQVLKRLTPTDNLWYQEFTLLGDRLLVTHSSRGIELIDIKSGDRLLYIYLPNRPETLTLYTPNGEYFVYSPNPLDRPLPAEFPSGLDLHWSESETAVLQALRSALRIAKQSW